MLRFIKITLLFLLIASASYYSQPVRTERVEAELISELNSIQPGSKFWVALRFEILEGWHTYWRNAGDTGIPTKIKWDLPEGFSAGEIQWAYPKSIEIEGLVNFGYEGEVLHLVQITAPPQIEPGEVITLRARADWLVCKIECFPEYADLKLEIPVAAETGNINEKWFDAFNRTREKLPITLPEWKFQAVSRDSSILLNAESPAVYANSIQKVEFFPYEGGYFNYSAGQKFKKDEKGFSLEIKLENLRIGDPDKIEGILITDSGWRGAGSERSLEISLPVGLTYQASGEKNSINIGLALLFAFIGGIILNLMPCVLPVLSIKILGFVSQAGEDRKKIISHGSAFTAGVLISFWILAGLLLILRAGGEELGWGFQLQSPLFLLVLSAILFLFGLNLFGVFEIDVAGIANSKSLAKNGGYSGSFLSGIAATILATPCTAPFMGSALGFAITQPAVVTMTVFTSLALGMAFPYLLFSIFPGWLRFLPKPGAWMESLKQFMGFLLMATVIWLAWVLAVQTSADALIYLMICLLLSGLAAWIYGRWSNPIKSSRVRRISALVSLALLIAGFAFAGNNIESGPHSSGSIYDDSKWENYSEERINQLRAENKPFFIDFTAAWCLSCQVNKKVALNDEAVLAEFDELGVTLIKADWTSRDERITRALARYGRNSVPLYVLQGKNSLEPVILPEILTPDIVLNALNKLN